MVATFLIAVAIAKDLLLKCKLIMFPNCDRSRRSKHVGQELFEQRFQKPMA